MNTRILVEGGGMYTSYLGYKRVDHKQQQKLQQQKLLLQFRRKEPNKGQKQLYHFQIYIMHEENCSFTLRQLPSYNSVMPIGGNPSRQYRNKSYRSSASASGMVKVYEYCQGTYLSVPVVGRQA